MNTYLCRHNFGTLVQSVLKNCLRISVDGHIDQMPPSDLRLLLLMGLQKWFSNKVSQAPLFEHIRHMRQFCTIHLVPSYRKVHVLRNC